MLFALVTQTARQGAAKKVKCVAIALIPLHFSSSEISKSVAAQDKRSAIVQKLMLQVQELLQTSDPAEKWQVA